MIDTTTNIPYRYSRKNFNRFAIHIGEALLRFPQVHTVDPSPLAVETFANRCREAVKAKTLYAYNHESIDNNLFFANALQLTFGMGVGVVHIGPRKAVRALTANKAQAAGEARCRESLANAEHLFTDNVLLNELCMLVDRKAFQPLPFIIVMTEDKARIAMLESVYDVHFKEINPGKYQII